MSVGVRAATEADFAFLARHDRHVAATELLRCIRSGRVLIAADPDPVGWLRWGLFWDEHPFMNMLFVLAEHRGRGIGGALVDAWERERRAAGHALLLTSTLASETAQHFYRARGYADAGSLLLPGEPTELLLLKALATDDRARPGGAW